MLVIHDEQLARQLAEIAESEHRSVEEVLKSLLAAYPVQPSATSDDDLIPGTSAWVAAHIDEWAFEVGNPIDPTQADEILNTEFADELWSDLQYLTSDHSHSTRRQL